MNHVVVISVGGVISCSLFGYGFWLVMHVDQRLKARGYLFSAGGAGVQVVMNVLLQNRFWAAVAAANMAIQLYAWWNNGGGDGMKRRLKKWVQWLGFGPRTAPSAA